MTPNISCNMNKFHYPQELLFQGSFPVCSDVAMLDDRSEQATFDNQGCFDKIDQDKQEPKDCETVEAMIDRNYAMLEHNRACKDYANLNETDLHEIEALNELESHFKRIDSCNELNQMGKARRIKRRRKKSAQNNV